MFSFRVSMMLCLCFQGNRYEQEKLLKQSNTLYVGNLSFYTTEEQVTDTEHISKNSTQTHSFIL